MTLRLVLVGGFAGGLLAGLAGVWLALADQGTVVGTIHDLGTTAGTGVSSCETCHIPHEADGAAIWSGNPQTEGSLSGLAPGCYSCHDGTVASGAYAFDATLAQHPVKAGEAGKDCDLCHDPHLADYGSFIKIPSGANLCQVCHGHRSEAEHPVNVDTRQPALFHILLRGVLVDVKVDERQPAVVPRDTQWDPDRGDFSGTRLWNAEGTASGDYVKCLTCHAAHGTATATQLLTMSYTAAPGTGSTLCANCHRR